jgi:hypothetical protein
MKYLPGSLLIVAVRRGLVPSVHVLPIHNSKQSNKAEQNGPPYAA